MEGQDPKEDVKEQAPPQEDAAAVDDTAAASSAFLTKALPDQSKIDGRLDPLVGSVLAGRYEVLRRIGEGGMGAVYEARHTVIDKRVAVKVLLERLVEKRELVGRLLKEARLASAIGHENIVDVTDFGTTEDARSFVVMEYLDGEPLSALLAREAPLPASRCLNIIRQVASALEAAHDKGIVHRDIKPENIYLIRRGDDDFVKVVDFGVSKAVRTADEGPETLRLTRTGMLLGTPLYMSPEQARGAEDIDARADIWAVGIVFYECLTGEVPFRANNYLQVIAQVLNTEALPPSRMLPELGISASVEAVVMKALAKDRDLRYQRMSDLLVDLERLRSGDPNVTFDEPPSSAALQAQRVGPRWHLGIVGVLLLGAGVVFSLINTEKAQNIKPVRVLKPAPAQPAPAVPTQPGAVVMPSPAAAAPPTPLAPPVRQRRPTNIKAAVVVPTPTGPEDKPAVNNIKFLGDDVAPTSDKVFGKASSDAGPARGLK
ncbi:MAG: serine/threonine-protein kinase [Deltaproteobacteria bacterium]|nr:serine/threonine-protein kinase [Deltaproteobacteria bacterium]